MQELHLLHLSQWPILDQLRVEEALLRTDKQNWCILNSGSSPAIVMGISGKAECLVAPHSTLPLIRRFSGGGTVVVDQNTLFFTLICNRTALSIEPYPEPILRWMAALYSPLFAEGFALSENDFTLHGKKFAGHAQYLSKDRWLHHTTLLHDYSDEHMNCLLIPEKQPKYRKNKPHSEFICKLKEFAPDRDLFLERLKERLREHFRVKVASEMIVDEILERDHRRSTRVERCASARALLQIPYASG